MGRRTGGDQVQPMLAFARLRRCSAGMITPCSSRSTSACSRSVIAASFSSGANAAAGPRAPQSFPTGTSPAARAFSSPSPRIATGSTVAPVLLRKQADPRTEPRQLARRRPRPLGKHQHVEAPVHRLARVGKAALKVPSPRQRKHVEQRRQQEINQRPEQDEAPLPRHPLRVAEVPKSSSISPDIAIAIRRRTGPGSAYCTSGPSYVVT